jgi:hypothetical protein
MLRDIPKKYSSVQVQEESILLSYTRDGTLFTDESDV